MIKKRLFWSNILMILLPVIATAIIGGMMYACLIWLAVTKGAWFEIDDGGDFDMACGMISEMAEEIVKKDSDFSQMEPLLKRNNLAVEISAEGKTLYSYGNKSPVSEKMIAAADGLEGSTAVLQKGRGLYISKARAEDREYTIYMWGTYHNIRSWVDMKLLIAFAAALILLTILLSILLTNRLLIKFVLKRIEEPLELLAEGVHRLRDGNLDFRIAYGRKDEFKPVCEDFNEMAGRLQESVCFIQQQEQSRKELIAGISHDIRSPLTSIGAYVEGLLDGVAKTPEAQRRYLKTIKAKAEVLDHIVSQLFLFSKMELGNYPENLQTIRLDETISDIVAALRDEYLQKGLLIDTKLEAAELYADPVYIHRIVTNILENSLKYKDRERGKATITLRAEADGCHLSFADDGPGTPPETLPRLFEAFYRSDPSRQNPDKGSGLGLAIVANAVKRMGGEVKALAGEMGGLEIRIHFYGGKEHGKNTDC